MKGITWGERMTDTNAHNLKIKIETDEYIYWEYTEA